ncbi:hypothetical protein GCM10028818_57500 [Spirosoma horti]
MRTTVLYDLSDPFFDYLETMANQSSPVLAYSTNDILDLIGRIEAEGFFVPASLTIEQALVKAIDYTNARLSSSMRIVYRDDIVCISTVVYLEFPILG